MIPPIVYLLVFYVLFGGVNAQTTCVCDLTSASCDVNCCCDTDCRTNDTSTFSTCLETGFTPNTQQCIYDQVVFINNIATTSQIRREGLFCVQRDGFSESNFYVSPPCIVTGTCFQQATSSFTFQQAAMTTSVTTGSFYRSGDPIYVIYPNGTNGYFSIPSVGISSKCQDNNPVQYLASSATSCTRTSTAFALACSENPSLVCVNYTTAFKIAPSLDAFNQALNTSDPYNFVGLITITENNITQTTLLDTCTSLACSWTVSGTFFTITVNGTTGITAASVSLAFVQNNNTTTSFSQEYKVDFVNSPVGTTAVQRSGNPGYLVGRPLLAGNNTGGVNLNPNIGITIMQPSGDGNCQSTTSPPPPVLFGTDVSTGCKITYTRNSSQDYCSLLQEQIFLALDSNKFNRGNTLSVAMFGNASASNFDATLWVPVEVLNQPTATPSGGTGSSICENMVLGAQLQFLFAYSGALSNPQAQIVGARYSFEATRSLQATCFTPTCDTTHTAVVTLSVSFTDVSETPISVLQAQPTFVARLPSDFFFPFKSNANHLVQSDRLLAFLFSGVLVVLTLWIDFLC